MAKLDLKIDLSVLKKINFGALKAFSAMIWPLVIVLAGVIVLTAAILMGRSFKSKVQRESIPLETQVKTMMGTATPAAQVQIEKQYEDAYQLDANEIEKLAMESTQRELISYDIFPQPKDTSALIFNAYGKKFREKIEQLAASIKGSDCPSEDEVKSLIEKGSGAGSYSSRMGSAEQEKIKDEFFNARAKGISVYVNPADVAGYIFWGDYQYTNIEKGTIDCWKWQLGCWIAEDVFKTVDKMNKGSIGIVNAPVKRIEKIGFATPDKLYTTGQNSKMDQSPPKYIIKPEDQLTESYTARVSTDDINVVQFSIVMVLDTQAVLPFMQELCSEKEHKWRGYKGNEEEKTFKHNQITILESRIKPVDNTMEDHKKYRYGSNAVSEVELICEYIFYKKGYEQINPEMYKKPEPKPAEGADGGAPGGPGGPPGFGPGGRP